MVPLVTKYSLSNLSSQYCVFCSSGSSAVMAPRYPCSFRTCVRTFSQIVFTACVVLACRPCTVPSNSASAPESSVLSTGNSVCSFLALSSSVCSSCRNVVTVGFLSNASFESIVAHRVSLSSKNCMVSSSSSTLVCSDETIRTYSAVRAEDASDRASVRLRISFAILWLCVSKSVLIVSCSVCSWLIVAVDSSIVCRRRAMSAWRA